MAKRYFRIQAAGISFENMQSFVSEDGGDGYAEGLCVSGSASGLDGGSRFGGAWDAYDADNGEVVVLEGYKIAQIYDGYRIEPTKEIARFTKSEWAQMLEDGTADEYER